MISSHYSKLCTRNETLNPSVYVRWSQNYHHQGANLIRAFVLTVKAWFLYFFLLQRKYIHIKTSTFVIIYLVFRKEYMATGMCCYSTHSCTDIKIMSQPELWPSYDPELVMNSTPSLRVLDVLAYGFSAVADLHLSPSLLSHVCHLTCMNSCNYSHDKN